jgi:hypothetical protein
MLHRPWPTSVPGEHWADRAATRDHGAGWGRGRRRSGPPAHGSATRSDGPPAAVQACVEGMRWRITRAWLIRALDRRHGGAHTMRRDDASPLWSVSSIPAALGVMPHRHGSIDGGLGYAA